MRPKQSEVSKAIKSYLVDFISNPVGKDFDDYVRLRLAGRPMTQRDLLSLAVAGAIRG